MRTSKGSSHLLGRGRQSEKWDTFGGYAERSLRGVFCMAGQSNAYSYRRFAPLDLTSNDFDESVRAGNMKLISEYKWVLLCSKLRINQHDPVPCRGWTMRRMR
jgi:hypothetical protein